MDVVGSLLPNEEVTVSSEVEGRVEQVLHPKDLKVGMILGRDVISSTGLLLLSKGTQLNLKNIDVLKRYYDIDPTKRPIAVWSKR